MRGGHVLIAGLILVGGCGSGESGGNISSSNESSLAPQADSLTAAPAVQTVDLNCGQFKPQSAQRGQPADDVGGLRQGMTEAQVRGVLLCKNPSYAINTNKNNVSIPTGGQMSQINLNADTGLDKVNVWLLGPPGGEKVVHIDRTIEYPSGKELPIANIAQEVTGKYGTFDDTGYGNQRSGWIVRSRDGERMANGNTSYGECRSHSLRTDKALPCLHSISYEVVPNQQNPALASRFNVAITSFSTTNDMIVLTTEHQAKAVRRAEENAEQGSLDL
ncbi:hypothetical protein [Sphingobium lactosutens]|uniref:hypothetical protein n=1 Tax=Sphingobium lactosutens TaxID=522773 RepID=UPI0015BF8691|nr:hypothetical protein [Sphingobium lactosutens]